MINDKFIFIIKDNQLIFIEFCAVNFLIKNYRI